jgi:sugar phosphate isomerase/epimerase
VKLGLSSFTFGWAVGVTGHLPSRPLDENGLLDKCRQHGLKLLQIGDNLPLDQFDDARLGRLAQRAADEGVQLEVGTRGLTLDRVEQYAGIARRLKARLIRMVIDDSGRHPTAEAAAALLRECVPLLDGLTLGLENHDRFSVATLRRMIEAADSDRIGICLDTANSIGAGEGLETAVRELGALTVNLHIKDFAVTRVPHLMGFVVEGRPAGKGMLDVPQLLQQLARHGRCETAVVELWTPPERSIDETVAKESAWANQSLDYLKPLFVG